MPVSVSVRPATLQDAAALGQWYEEDIMRLADRRPAAVPPDGHRPRVEAILADPSRHLLILQVAAIRIGAALLEGAGGEWTVRVHLKPFYLGRGLAVQAETAARTWLAGFQTEARR